MKDREIIEQIFENLFNLFYGNREKELNKKGYTMLQIDGIDIKEKRKKHDELVSQFFMQSPHP